MSVYKSSHFSTPFNLKIIIKKIFLFSEYRTSSCQSTMPVHNLKINLNVDFC